MLDDVIIVTRRMSEQIIFSLHAEINSIELEDNFLIKPMRLLNESSNNQGKKRTLNDFIRKFGTVGSTECTAVSSLSFLCYL